MGGRGVGVDANASMRRFVISGRQEGVSRGGDVHGAYQFCRWRVFHEETDGSRP